MPSASKDRKLIAGRWVRWNAERAASACARGLWIHDTLMGCLRQAAQEILPSLRDRELLFILQDVESRVVFVPSVLRQQDYAAMMSRVIAQMDSPPDVVVVRGDAGSHAPYGSLFQRNDGKYDLPVLDPDAVRMILYTSGTTGRPKGVLHSHNSIHALICQIRKHWFARAKFKGICLWRRVRTALAHPRSGRVFRGRCCDSRLWLYGSACYDGWID